VVSNKVYQNRVVWTGETRDGTFSFSFLLLLFCALFFSRLSSLSRVSSHLLPLKTLEEEGF